MVNGLWRMADGISPLQGCWLLPPFASQGFALGFSVPPRWGWRSRHSSQWLRRQMANGVWLMADGISPLQGCWLLPPFASQGFALGWFIFAPLGLAFSSLVTMASPANGQWRMADGRWYFAPTGLLASSAFRIPGLRPGLLRSAPLGLAFSSLVTMGSPWAFLFRLVGGGPEFQFPFVVAHFAQGARATGRFAISPGG
jgi:hypothetical protein